MFTNKFDYLYSIQNEEILKIVPEYPKKSLNPRQILSCSISSKKFVNAEFIEEPLVIIWES